MELLESTLYEKTGNEDYYRVSSVSQMLDTVNELTGTLTLVLECIILSVKNSTWTHRRICT